MLKDDTGSIRARFFNQPYLLDTLSKGKALFVWGQVERQQGLLPEIEKPQVEPIDEDAKASIHTGRVVPVYERIQSLGGELTIESSVSGSVLYLSVPCRMETL